MKGHMLLKSIGYVDEAFVADAMTVRPHRAGRWRKYAALAACLALAAGTALWWSQRPYVIALDQVPVNQVSAVHRVEPDYDPETVQLVSWDSAQIAEYYGKDLTPAYVPKNLELVEDGDAVVLVDDSGTVVNDAVELDFYTGYDPDGTLGSQNIPGFTMTVSTGDTLVYEYADPETMRQLFSINGVEVTLGEITITDTNGEYQARSVYTAEFTLGDRCYALRFHQMQMVEIVKVVASIIWEDSNIVVE